MSNITKDYELTLQKQCKELNFKINEKAEALKTIPVDNFVLNENIQSLISEIKELNEQRDSILKELNKLKEDK